MNPRPPDAGGLAMREFCETERIVLPPHFRREQSDCFATPYMKLLILYFLPLSRSKSRFRYREESAVFLIEIRHDVGYVSEVKQGGKRDDAFCTNRTRKRNTAGWCSENHNCTINFSWGALSSSFFLFLDYTSARQLHGVFSFLLVKTPLIAFQSIFNWRKKTF